MRRIPAGPLVALGVLSLLLAGCGGGGGGGEGVGGPTLPGPSGSAKGRVTFVRGIDPLVVEQEPNDDFGDAQSLGDRFPGQSVTIVGSVDADAAADVFDAFRLRLPVRSRVTATLNQGPAHDFDLALYDPVGMQFVEVVDVGAVGSVVFDLQGTVDFVVTANSGAGAYELELVVDTSQGGTEREPNDTGPTADYVGIVPVGGGFDVAGSADAATDAVDAFLVACPEAVTLGVSLEFPAFTNFDVRVSDVTTDIASPVLLQSFDATSPPPEAGSLGVSAGTLLLVEVRAVMGSGAWSLSVNGTAPPPPLVAPQALLRRAAPALASLSLEASRLAHPHADRRYGEVDVDVAPGEALICFHEGAGERGAAELARVGAHVEAELPGIACKVDLDVPGGLTDADARRLTISRACAAACGACVRYSEPNRIRRMTATPDDEYYGLQWHYDMINLGSAWDITTGSSSVIVAVIDTGRISHADLNGRWIGGYDTVSHPSFTGDGDGPDSDPSDLGVETGYHGTHVAGTIGANTNNGEGVAGVTWATGIMPIRALGNFGAGTDFDIAAGILWAAGLPNSTGTTASTPAHVINMSLGGPGFNQTMANACSAARGAGLTIVAAAGNDNSSVLQYPASYAGVISVSALDAQKNRAPYSSFGTEVDIAAPGGNTAVDTTGDGFADGVLSTVGPGSNYTFYNGTSMASPHVAGVAALLLAIDDTLTPTQVEAILTGTAQDLGSAGRDNVYGHGLVDAFAALASIQPPPGGGGGGPTDPLLLVNPGTLSFGSSTTQLDVTIRNGGGGLLSVTGIELVQEPGETWLSFQPLGTGDATRSVDGLRFLVDRAGLTTGTYFARVILRSNGGDREIGVAMQKTLSVPPPPDLDIHVFAVSVDSGETVAEVVVNPSVSLDYTFGGLPAGRYIFIAATDTDGDGVFDESGEYQGAYPIETDPVPVDVTPNFTTININFDVRLQQVLGGLAASALQR